MKGTIEHKRAFANVYFSIVVVYIVLCSIPWQLWQLRCLLTACWYHHWLPAVDVDTFERYIHTRVACDDGRLLVATGGNRQYKIHALYPHDMPVWFNEVSGVRAPALSWTTGSFPWVCCQGGGTCQRFVCVWNVGDALCGASVLACHANIMTQTPAKFVLATVTIWMRRLCFSAASWTCACVPPAAQPRTA